MDNRKYQFSTLRHTPWRSLALAFDPLDSPCKCTFRGRCVYPQSATHQALPAINLRSNNYRAACSKKFDAKDCIQYLSANKGVVDHIIELFQVKQGCYQARNVPLPVCFD